MTLQGIQKDLFSKQNKSKAKLLQGFFKTGKGEYGEGDIFLGITVPEQRKVAIKHKYLDKASLKKLLLSEFHEHRLTALMILVEQFGKANKEKNEIEKKNIFNFYIRNAKQINNWDLVDLSAPKIVGEYLADKNAEQRKILYKLAKSKNLWEKRISIISTFAFIKRKDFVDTIKISEILLEDKHDLIQKANGWMLREVGKRDKPTEEKFLKKHYKKTPRTMLRYAIEKFPEKERKSWLLGKLRA